MPKLPDNLVQSFDNPLRRTTRPAPRALEVDQIPADGENETPDGDENANNLNTSGENIGGVVIPIAAKPKPKARIRTARHTVVEADDAVVPEGATALQSRITVRIDDDVRCALESESHKRRIAGEKTNVAEVARGILAQWVRQRPSK